MTSPAGQWLPRIFAGLLGAFLGLSLLKFGNPPIMEKWVTAPSDVYELVLGYPWPISWAYRLLGLVVIVGACVAWRRFAGPVGTRSTASHSSSLPGSPTQPRWLFALPLPWLVWQFLAAAQTMDSQLTNVTLKHFVACAAFFYLGFFSLSQVGRLQPFWLGLLGGFLLVLVAGFEQHFGGLEESRRYFYLYVYPHMKEIPPGYLKKMASGRIFATLFYPNALAGVLLLLLPAMLVMAWRICADWLTPGAKSFLVSVVGLAGLACLYWSGSKGGWLLMLLLGVVVVLRLRLPKPFKLALITGVLLAGLIGFFWRHAVFFQKGATSVSARFDYWRAALQTAADRPFFGTGPGTFAIPYEKIKKPESEMSRMVHNDYLEQASDSGVVGFLSYAFLIVGGLAWSLRTPPRLPPRSGDAGSSSSRPPPRPRLRPRTQSYGDEDDDTNKGNRDNQTGWHRFFSTGEDWLRFSVWLGLLGWSLQSLLEFSLYIPALAWLAFTLLGWLLGLGGRGIGAQSADPEGFRGSFGRT